MALLASVSAASRAQAQSALDDYTKLSPYNLVVNGNASGQINVGGASVIGGNISNGGNFDSQKGAYGVPALTVYGNLGSGDYNVNSGGTALVVGKDSGRINFNGGGSLSTAAPLTNFAADFATPMRDLSSQLGVLATNSSFPVVTDQNNVTLKATPGFAGIAVFNINSTAFAGVAGFNIDANGANAVIVNIVGDFAQKANFNGMFDGSLDAKLIWNFETATSVSLTGFGGMVLAPLATVTNSSAVNGSIYAANYVANGPLQAAPFTGVLPATAKTNGVKASASSPAPAPLPLLGTSVWSVVLMCLAAARKRITRAA